jgi:leucyl aminopeptidase
MWQTSPISAEFFIDNHTSWAHLDIAAMAIVASELGTHRSATTYGVRLLTEYLDSVSQD